MSIADDISEATRRHKPVLHLVKERTEEKRQEIEYETSTSHAISSQVQALTGALEALVKIASTRFGFALIERELMTLPRSVRNVCALSIGALIESKKDGQS